MTGVELVAKDASAMSLTVTTTESEEVDQEQVSIPLSPRKQIKSTAVVKCSHIEIPERFIPLKLYTDLNPPPDNWLRQSSEWKGFHFGRSHASQFSSFGMAFKFANLLGDADVMSDSQNIKKLLKIPFCKNAISMVVHSINNTLLIDDFDLPRLLKTDEEKLSWLKEFYWQHVVSGEKEKYSRKAKSRLVLQHKSLESKFLYYSLTESPDSNSSSGLSDSPTAHDPDNNHDDEPTLMPEFARNVLWTFEDIQMLIGSDIPIFGRGMQPCVSLRLRDMNKPINVLTGIDYWLDNLMCNVPEVMMCYHLEGIVQKYEVYKTEDLPHRENSKFKPSVIRDVAQNILSFLKYNCTKEGHTYWLFKAKDDDVVKLYDLTSLCHSNEEDGRGETPFARPVGILLYRVASRMLHHDGGVGQKSTVHALLKNCILLLHHEQDAEIMTAAHLMLSELYVPGNTDPTSPNLSSCSEDDANSSQWDDYERPADYPVTAQSSVVVPDLCLPVKKALKRDTYRPPPITGGTEERCRAALQHVVNGLKAIQYTAEQVENKKNYEDINFSGVPNSGHAIPMPYTPLKGNLDEKGSALNVSVPKTVEVAEKTDHYRNSLIRKAVLVYATLSELSYQHKDYSKALQSVHMFIQCARFIPVENIKNHCALIYGIAGDSYFMVAKSPSLPAECLDAIDTELLNVLGCDDVIYQLDKEDTESLLYKSLESYEAAKKLYTSKKQKNNLRSKFGNIRNELGVYHMHRGQELKDDRSSSQSHFEKSMKHLKLGIEDFSSINDTANVALLNSNMGSLLRSSAHILTDNENSKELGEQERKYYTEALDRYQYALRILGSREKNPQVYDRVTWEYSTTLVTFASVLQDFAPLSMRDRDDIEREIIDLMLRSLKYCDVETENIRQPFYQERAATIHFRLATLYHSGYRNPDSTEARKRLCFQNSWSHYTSSAKLYHDLECTTQYLRVQTEKACLTEFQAGEKTGNAKPKCLRQALDIFIESQAMILELTKEKLNDEECTSTHEILLLIRRKVQEILQEMLRMHMQRKAKKGSDDFVCTYKDAYSISLKKLTDTTEPVPIMAASTAQALEEIRKRLIPDGTVPPAKANNVTK